MEVKNWVLAITFMSFKKIILDGNMIVFLREFMLWWEIRF